MTHQAMAEEPKFQNRSVTEWLRDFDSENPTPQQFSITADAIRQIGTNSLPLLIDYLSEARNELFLKERNAWRENQATNDAPSPRPACSRFEALAALDALGSEAAGALPALEKMLDENPPDPQVLYVVARMGPIGAPLLNKCLTSTNKFLRLEAQVCFELIQDHSEVLYPHIPVGPDAPSFQKRTCEFNVKILQASLKIYTAEHPGNFSADSNSYYPPPSVLPK